MAKNKLTKKIIKNHFLDLEKNQRKFPKLPPKGNLDLALVKK